MANTALISIFVEDRIGLVAAMTGRLFDLGANLGDTTFARLRHTAEFTSICELPQEMSLADVERELRSLPALEKAQVSVLPFRFSTEDDPTARITHRIEMSGADSPGLIARLSEVFLGFGANIIRLNSQQHMPGTTAGQYTLRMAVWIPEDKARACLATIANTAGELKLDLRWEKAETLEEWSQWFPTAGRR